MATAAEIGWGKYREFEGAFYRGKRVSCLPLALREDPKFDTIYVPREG